MGRLEGFESQIKKILEICQTAGPIVNKFGTRMQISLHVNGHSWLKKSSPSRPRGALWREVRGSHIELLENCHYSSTCLERTPSGPGKSVRTLQVAARHRDGWAGGGRQI